MKVTHIRVIDETHTEVTREAKEQQWDADDTDTSHSISGITVSEDNEYFDISVGYPIDEDKSYYLLYVIYSTGDSFHREDGRITFIDLYKGIKTADKAASIIEKDYKTWRDKEDKWSVKIPGSSGEMLELHCSWKGYFESLTGVHVERVLVLSKYYSERH